MSKVGDIIGIFFLLCVVGMLVANQNTTNAISSFTTALSSLITVAMGGSTSGGTQAQGGTGQ